MPDAGPGPGAAGPVSACCFCGGRCRAGRRQGAVPGGRGAACAICHTLKDAGAEGAIGPVQDELKPEAARVAKAVKDGIGLMPPYVNLSEQQIQALAVYVARATAAKP